MNSDNYHNSFCNCKKFSEDLLLFSKEVFSDTNEKQWEKFKIFSNEYQRQYPQTPEIGDNIFLKSCSQRLFSMLFSKRIYLNRQDAFQNGEINLSKLLLNTIGFIHLEKCLFGCSCFLGYLNSNTCLQSKENNTIRILCALDGRSEFMKVLVNLDLVSNLKDDSPKLVMGLHRILINFILSVDADYEDRFSTAVKIKNLAKNTFFCNNYHGSFKRIYLAMIAIQAALLSLKKEENTAKEIIYCIRMYFVSIQEPYLTMNEMGSMLYACLILLEKLHLFEPLYEKFMKFMPECPAKFEPRNLTDLARCQIRNNLKKCNLPLLKGVEKLNLAQPLKRFVVGDVIEMSRKSGNTSIEQVKTRLHFSQILFERPMY